MLLRMIRGVTSFGDDDMVKCRSWGQISNAFLGFPVTDGLQGLQATSTRPGLCKPTMVKASNSKEFKWRQG